MELLALRNTIIRRENDLPSELEQLLGRVWEWPPLAEVGWRVVWRT